MNGKMLFYALVSLAILVDVSPAAAQESGADIWARTCGSCHRQQPPSKYDADSWRAIMGHMALNARLTSAEEAAVREFLMGAARPLAAEKSPMREPVRVASNDPAFWPSAVAEPGGAELYRQNCQACHGSEGKGDGPAAAALTPRPTDLTDPQVMGKLSDDELFAILKDGKGAMPGFGKRLSDDEIRALVAYVRRLAESREDGS